MKAVRLTALAFAAALVLGVAACGGGGKLASGGIGGTGITAAAVSQGSITRIGSVEVNGVLFNTDNATITVDGMNEPLAALSEGMVVTVTGAIDADGTGTAESVEYSSLLQGLVADVAPDGSSLHAMGRRVLIDNVTLFGPQLSQTGVNNLIPDQDIVEVSGFEDPSGNVRATYIEKIETTDSTEHKVTGTITALDPPSRTFAIGNLSVDGTQLANLFDFNNGDYVKVSGTGFSSGQLIATDIDLATADLGETDREDAEKEGLVTSAPPGTTFYIFGQPVTHDPSRKGTTQYDGGLPTDIKAGVRLEVEGTLVNGVLNATRIEFEDAIELEADVATKNDVNSTLTLRGLDDGLGGITVEVSDSLTQFSGTATDFASIDVGEHVEIRGRETNGTVFATEVEAGPADTEVVLQGPVDSVNDPFVTILGVAVDTTTVDNANFEIDDVPVTQTEFFQAVEVGDLVEVEGTFSGGAVLWEAIELDQ